MERIKQLAGHLAPASATTTTGVAALQVKRPDDVVITLAVRSPLGKQKKGAFKDTPPDEFLTSFLKATLPKTQIDPALIEDFIMGNTLNPGVAYVMRASMLAAGIPYTTPFQAVNRFCSSGLMAVNTVANRIKAGEISIGLAGGFENMSVTPDAGAPKMGEDITSVPVAVDSLQPMGWTSENVAADYAISREDMDEFAYRSQSRASHADKSGLFAKEIVPFEIRTKDPSTGEVRKVVVAKDDVIRHGTQLSTLSQIRPAFPHWPPSLTTGGNASQNSDGAALVLLMRRSKAEELGLKILAKYVTTSVVGVPPRIMGIGPSVAIPAVLESCGIGKEDVDLFEINEAFASMYVYCVRTLGLDPEKVNVNGGAIALGHPLDTSLFLSSSFVLDSLCASELPFLRARQIATGLAELERRKGKILVTSMCMGAGMGAAAVFVNETI